MPSRWLICPTAPDWERGGWQSGAGAGDHPLLADIIFLEAPLESEIKEKKRR